MGSRCVRVEEGKVEYDDFKRSTKRSFRRQLRTHRIKNEWKWEEGLKTAFLLKTHLTTSLEKRRGGDEHQVTVTIKDNLQLLLIQHRGYLPPVFPTQSFLP